MEWNKNITLDILLRISKDMQSYYPVSPETSIPIGNISRLFDDKTYIHIGDKEITIFRVLKND